MKIFSFIFFVIVLLQLTFLFLSENHRNDKVHTVRNTKSIGSGGSSSSRSSRTSKRNKFEDDIEKLLSGGVILSQAEWNVFSKLAGEWARESPEELLDWGRKLESPRAKYHALSFAAAELLEGSPEQGEMAWRLLDDLASGEIRDTVIDWAFRNFLESDPERALALVNSVSTSLRIRSIAQVLATSEFGDNSAQQLMNSLSHGAFRNAFAKSYIEEASRDDPRAALALLEENQDFDGHEESYRQLAFSFSLTAPQDGIEMSSNIENSIIREKFIEELVSGWGIREPEEAGQWYMSKIFESGLSDFNENMTRKVVGSWIRADPEKPFALVESVGPFENKDSLVRGMVEELSKYDPSNAAERLNSDLDLPSAQKSEVVERIMENWMDRDSHSATNWANGLIKGSERDAALSVLVDTVLVKDRDFTTATLWVNELSDEGIRNEFFERMRKMQEN